jgi:hypothetical protein
MANPLDTVQLNQIVSAVLAALQVSQSSPKGAPISQPIDRLAQKDAAIKAGFARRGIKDVVLMDRADKSRPIQRQAVPAVVKRRLAGPSGRAVDQGLISSEPVRPDCAESYG